jgi:hypothetical protein
MSAANGSRIFVAAAITRWSPRDHAHVASADQNTAIAVKNPARGALLPRFRELATG